MIRLTQIDGMIVRPQYQIERFRVDFLIKFVNGAVYETLVVECDGHDFHERTKEQAAKDKSRDRRLKILGYQVLRFSGSEIDSDPVHCACDVFRYVEYRRGDAHGTHP